MNAFPVAIGLGMPGLGPEVVTSVRFPPRVTVYLSPTISQPYLQIFSRPCHLKPTPPAPFPCQRNTPVAHSDRRDDAIFPSRHAPVDGDRDYRLRGPPDPSRKAGSCEVKGAD